MEAPNPEFMGEAIRLSIEKMQAGFGEPFGAVVVKDGQIITHGFNQVTATHDPTCHAEVGAVRKTCKALGTFQLDGCDLYTNYEPCPMCLGAIYWARPRRVFYGNTKIDADAIDFDDPFIYEELDRPMESRELPMTQLLRYEALAGFRAWTKLEGKTEYQVGSMKLRLRGPVTSIALLTRHRSMSHEAEASYYILLELYLND